jgi:hypothetical protein
MRAAVFEGDYPSARTAKENDRLAGEPRAQRFSSPDLMRPGDRIPEIGMRIDASQVEMCIHGYRLPAFFSCLYTQAAADTA